MSQDEHERCCRTLDVIRFVILFNEADRPLLKIVARESSENLHTSAARKFRVGAQLLSAAYVASTDEISLLKTSSIINVVRAITAQSI